MSWPGGLARWVGRVGLGGPVNYPVRTLYTNAQAEIDTPLPSESRIAETGTEDCSHHPGTAARKALQFVSFSVA